MVSEHIKVEDKIGKLLVCGASQLMSIILPVTVCITITTILVLNRPPPILSFIDMIMQGEAMYDEVITPKSQASDFGQSFVFVIGIISAIAAMTFGLVILFKYAPPKVIKGIFSGLMMTIFSCHNLSFIAMVVKGRFIPIDFISVLFCVYNFAVVGVVSIVITGPLLLRQMYMIYLGVCVSYMLLALLPKYVVWILVTLLVVWDIIAVLCPRGPLNMLINVVTKKDKQLLNPLMYSTAANIIMTNKTSGENSVAYDVTPQTVPLSHENEVEAAQNNQVPETNQVPEAPPEVDATKFKTQLDVLEYNITKRDESGMHLGMGDFVFYSLLISRAAIDGKLAVCVVCYLAIILGLIMTVVILIMVGRALPALPISITLSVILYVFALNNLLPFIIYCNKKRAFFF